MIESFLCSCNITAAMTTEQQDLLKKLGEKIKSLRTERGLTLKEMGYKVEKEPQSISRLEMGKINPSYLYLIDISKGLDVELHDLLK